MEPIITSKNTYIHGYTDAAVMMMMIIIIIIIIM